MARAGRCEARSGVIYGGGIYGSGIYGSRRLWQWRFAAMTCMQHAHALVAAVDMCSVQKRGVQKQGVAATQVRHAARPAGWRQKLCQA